MYFIFRNYTLEPFFRQEKVKFSGYGDISYIDEDVYNYIWFYLPPIEVDATIAASQILHYLQQAKVVFNQILPNKNIIAFTMFDLFSNKIEISNDIIGEALIKYNEGLKAYTKLYPNLKIVDIYDFIKDISKDDIIDWKYFFMAQIPLNPKFVNSFSEWFKRIENAILYKRKKCIVLDLDNTLWGGILGEDGINGIKIGGDYPGNAFLFFQRQLLELSKTGIILTICSKNNETDVLEVWKKNPFLILKKQHFTICKINWNNKADNIYRIAKELNIGLDSIIFIDDNPFERELIKNKLPMVEVPDFPDEPYQLPDFFKSLVNNYFLTYKLTDEDKKKSLHYMENIRREDFKSEFSNLNAYIASLNIQIEFQKVNSSNISRISQLTQKTNQFNLTTKRYSTEDIAAFVERGDTVLCINVRDRFGDNGLTGVLIANKNNNEIIIDTFLLSCRILGKKIEDVFLQYVLLKFKNQGYKIVRAIYKETAKNIQVKNFYENMGFSLHETIGEEKRYFLLLEEFNMEISNKYSLNEYEKEN